MALATHTMMQAWADYLDELKAGGQVINGAWLARMMHEWHKKAVCRT